MFRFVPYLICICIFYVIWQLNTLNGFSFQLIKYAISAIKKNSEKETNYFDWTMRIQSNK